MDPDIAARVRQGADARTSPDILARLAEDPSATVRASLALNPALPPWVSAKLALDGDERVRGILDRKLASLISHRSGGTQGVLHREAVRQLTELVAQAALRVRANVAQVVRDLPDGPRQIVLRLAHDPEIMVAEPVIRFSPMLTSEDLIELIAAAPSSGTVMAVAQRHGINEDVSDAVVEAADVDAIRALLANHSSQIRDAALDALAAQSEEHTTWQEPLVRRPSLPSTAQRVLADIVTGSLLETLSARPDLDPRVGQQIRRALTRTKSYGTDLRPPEAMVHAQALHDAGRLDDMLLLDTLRDHAFVLATAMLAVRAGVPMTTVEQAFLARNAQAVVALAWRAGMSMQTAVVVQAALARLPPDTIIRCGSEGGYTLPIEEMQQQLRALGVLDTGPRKWVPRRVEQKSAPE